MAKRRFLGRMAKRFSYIGKPSRPLQNGSISAYRGDRKGGSDYKHSGTRGIRHSHGYLTEREKNSDLRRSKKYETYSDFIANIPAIAASMRFFFAVIQKTEWRAEGEKDNADSERYAEDINLIMKRMDVPMSQVMRRASAYYFYGFSVQEWTAKRLKKEGLIGLESIEPRSQYTITRWDIDPNGQINGVWQQNPNTADEHYIPRKKMIHCVDDVLNDSPEGLGILRQLYATAKRYENYLFMEEVGFENDLHGVPVVRVPLERLSQMVDDEELTEKEAEDIIATYEGFLDDHTKKNGKAQGMMVDSETFVDEDGKPSNVRAYDIEILKAQSAAQQHLADAIERLEKRMALLLSTTILFLGEDGAGSLALSKDKMTQFLFTLTSVLQDLSETYKRDMFRQLARMNGWDVDSLPDLVFEEPKMQDILEITEAFRNMATAGASFPPDDPIWNHLRLKMGVPELPEDMLPDPMEFGLPDLDALGVPGKKPSGNANSGKQGDDDAPGVKTGDDAKKTPENAK